MAIDSNTQTEAQAVPSNVTRVPSQVQLLQQPDPKTTVHYVPFALALLRWTRTGVSYSIPTYTYQLNTKCKLQVSLCAPAACSLAQRLLKPNNASAASQLASHRPSELDPPMDGMGFECLSGGGVTA